MKPPNRITVPVHYLRQGTILLVVMVCLTIITILTGSLIKTVMFQHRQMQREQKQHQARWLLQSGLERAAYRLSRDENYPGETWTISAEELQGEHSAEVNILIEPVAADDPTGQVRMSVTARYPLETQTIQLSKSRIIPRDTPSGENP